MYYIYIYPVDDLDHRSPPMALRNHTYESEDARVQVRQRACMFKDAEYPVLMLCIYAHPLNTY